MKTDPSCMRSVVCALALGLGLSGTASCGGPSAKAPQALRPIDEGRAVKLISEALKKEGFAAEGPKEVAVSGKTSLVVDVGVAGKHYGIVYLTAADITSLGDHPLATKKQLPGDPLTIQRGEGKSSDVNFVVLYAGDYSYDANAGETHDATVIAAEQKLERDVLDFLTIAKKENFQ